MNALKTRENSFQDLEKKGGSSRSDSISSSSSSESLGSGSFTTRFLGGSSGGAHTNPQGKWKGLLSKRKKEGKREVSMDTDEHQENYMRNREYNLGNLEERERKIQEIQNYYFSFFTPSQFKELIRILDQGSSESQPAPEGRVSKLYRQAVALILFPSELTIQGIRNQWRSRRDKNEKSKDGPAEQRTAFSSWERKTLNKKFFGNVVVEQHLMFLQEAIDNLHPEDFLHKHSEGFGTCSSKENAILRLKGQEPGTWCLRRSSLFQRRNFLVLFPSDEYILPEWNQNPCSRNKPLVYVLSFVAGEKRDDGKGHKVQHVLLAQYGPTWVHLQPHGTTTPSLLLKEGYRFRDLGLPDPRESVRVESDDGVTTLNPLSKTKEIQQIPVYKVTPGYSRNSFLECLMTCFASIETNFL